MRLELALANAFAGLFRLLPHRAAQRLGSILAVLVHDIAHIRAGVAADNLLRAYPDEHEPWAKETVRRVYSHFGAVAAELARIPVLARGDFDRWIATDEESVRTLDRAVGRGRGGFVVSGHLGNWELVGAWAAWKGYPTTYVVAEQTNPLIEELIDRHRAAAGVEIVKRADAAKGVLRALRRGRIVAMMIDQDARRDGLMIPFFGRPASTFRGVGAFAAKLRPAVISLESWRERDGRIHFRMRDVRIPDTGDRDTDARLLMVQLTRRLETYIRRHPEQWLWLHRRWKTRVRSL